MADPSQPGPDDGGPSAEFAGLPRHLRDVAFRMLAELARTHGLGGLSAGEAARVIASPAFRPVLEGEERLDRLTFLPFPSPPPVMDHQEGIR